MEDPECPGAERRLYELAGPDETEGHRLAMTTEINFLTGLEAEVQDGRVGRLVSSEASLGDGYLLPVVFPRSPSVYIVSKFHLF